MFKVVTEEEVMNYASRIQDFEYGAGESFTDYFLDDEVKEVSWAFWLNGYATATGNVKLLERSNAIINDIGRLQGKRHLCQHWKFDINTEPHWEWSDEYNEHVYWGSEDMTDDERDNAQTQDYILWARFLTSTERYREPLDEYLTKFENGEPY